MAKKKLSDREVKAYILRKLKNRCCWGGKYKPTISVASWAEGKIKRNGKRVKKLIDELVKDRFLYTKKRGNVISLNSHRKKQVMKYIKNNLKQNQ